MFTGLTSEFAGAIPMKNWCSRFCRLALAAGAVMVLRAGPSLAQSEELPCSAFSRNVYGGWRVLSPVMLDLNGRLYSPTVGSVFAAGSTQNGIEMSDVLDQQCGDR
jgi:hypothetical protein